MKIKKSTKLIIDSAFIAGGIALVVIGFLSWKEMGFQIEHMFVPNPQEGRSRFALTVIGIAFTAYGVFDIIILRKSKNISKT